MNAVDRETRRRLANVSRLARAGSVDWLTRRLVGLACAELFRALEAQEPDALTAPARAATLAALRVASKEFPQQNIPVARIIGALVDPLTHLTESGLDPAALVLGRRRAKRSQKGANDDAFMRRYLIGTALRWHQDALDRLSAKGRKQPAAIAAGNAVHRAEIFFGHGYDISSEPAELEHLRAAFRELATVGVGTEELITAYEAQPSGGRSRGATR